MWSWQVLKTYPTNASRRVVWVREKGECQQARSTWEGGLKFQLHCTRLASSAQRCAQKARDCCAICGVHPAWMKRVHHAYVCATAQRTPCYCVPVNRLSVTNWHTHTREKERKRAWKGPETLISFRHQPAQTRFRCFLRPSICVAYCVAHLLYMCVYVLYAKGTGVCVSVSVFDEASWWKWIQV